MTENALITVYVSLLVLMFICCALNFVLLFRLYRHLQDVHPDLWAGLGSPSLFLNNSIANNMAVLRFVHGKRPHQIDDSRLQSLSRQLVIVQWTGGMVMLLGLVIFVLLYRLAA